MPIRHPKSGLAVTIEAGRPLPIYDHVNSTSDRLFAYGEVMRDILYIAQQLRQCAMKPASKSPFSIRRDQIDRRHLQRLSQFEQRHHGRIAGAAFQAADVLLAVAGFLGKLLLCQTAREPDLQHIPPDQLPHVHADWLDGYRRANLSTMVCKLRLSCCRFHGHLV